MRQSKDELRAEIESLRTEVESLRDRQRRVDDVIAAVAGRNGSEEVITRLHAGQSVSEIHDWINGTRSLSPPHATALRIEGPLSSRLRSSLVTSVGDISFKGFSAESMGHADELLQGSPRHLFPESYISDPLAGSHDVESSPEGRPRFFAFEQILWPQGMPNTESKSGTWTNITSDIGLIHHLLALYFCWEYPIFAPFRKESFLRDFHEGRNRYCSPLLANALLALSCRFSTLPFIRADSNDPNTAGDHFFAEAERLLEEEADHRSLTTVQALNIMSVRAISCGRVREGRYYSHQSIRLAIELGLHSIQNEENAELLTVQSSTFWGAFTLDM